MLTIIEKYRGLHVLAISEYGKVRIYNPFNLNLILISVKDWEVSPLTVNEILAKFTYSQYSGFKNLFG